MHQAGDGTAKNVEEAATIFRTLARGGNGADEFISKKAAEALREKEVAAAIVAIERSEDMTLFVSLGVVAAVSIGAFLYLRKK